MYTCYFASELILPILLAAFFALLLSPLMKRLASRWVPRWIAAFLLIALTLATFMGIGNALYVPAAEWVGRAPQVLREATPRLKSLLRPIAEANRMGQSLSEITGDAKAGKQQVVIQAPAPPSLLETTPRILASVLAVVLLTYFFLLFGDSLLRRTLMMRSTWEKKRITVEIVRSIQSDLSRYVLTVCSTSIVLGCATMAALDARRRVAPVVGRAGRPGSI